MEGDSYAYFFSMMQTLVVILQRGRTLLLSGFTLSGIHDIATKDFLPEGKAAGGTWKAVGGD